MKPVKHFVKQVRVNGQGKVVQSVVLTPPLDTTEQAQAYADWYKTPDNDVRYCIENMMQGLVAGRTTADYSVLVFETTLY